MLYQNRKINKSPEKIAYLHEIAEEKFAID